LEEVHAFQLHLIATGISWPSLNQIVCALRFFYGVTLGQDTVPERIAYAREPSKLPVVLSATGACRSSRGRRAKRVAMTAEDIRHLQSRSHDARSVYAKSPFGGPEQVLAYLGRYTHRVAIANSRLLSLAAGKVRFTWKDYRQDSKTKVMTLDADEFIRRFLLHTLPDGFHRIRHYGFLANGSRGHNLACCRRMLDNRDTGVDQRADNRTKGDRPLTAADFAICPDCGGTMRRIAIVPRCCNAAPFSPDTS
jgi:hypothetical protein